MATTGSRTSECVTDDFNVAAQVTSGVVDAIKSTRDAQDAPLSDLDRSAPTKTNPAMGDHLGLGRTLTSSGKKDEHERKGIFQGPGMAGKGYVHHYPDITATTNLEMANGPPVKSWKSLVSIPVKSGSPLQFYRPHCVDGKLVARPPAEAVNEGIDMWKGCLVGQFLDKRLLFPVVRSLVNRLWGKREMPDISTTKNGLFFFIFKDPEARD